MPNQVTLYDRMTMELLLARGEPGHTPERESELVAALDDLWWKLSPEEQATVETRPQAPESLGLVDQDASTGVAPRKPSEPHPL
jgi:hypothetical protein